MLAAFLFTGVVNVLTLATPLFTLQVFETVVPSGSLETLVLLALMAGATVTALMLIEIVRDRIMLRAATWLDHTLGQHLLENGLKSGTSADEMQAEIRSLAVLRGFLTGPLLLSLFDAPWMPLFIVALLVLHPLLGLLALVAAGLLLMAGILLTLMTGHLLEETQTAAERADRWWRAVAGRGQVAGALGLTVGATEQWELYNRSHVAGAYSLGKRTGLVKALTRCIRVATQIAVYAIGAHLVIKAELSPGALVASAILLARALAPLEASVMAFRSAGLALRAYRRLKAHAADARTIEVGDSAGRPQGHLNLTDVTFYHAGRKSPSLHNVSLTLAPGECLAIVGPNGAGKSSLAAVIAGAAAPQMGSADLDGVPIVRWQRGASEPPVGYLPDDAPLIEGTVHENIARFRDASLLAVVRAAMQVGMHDTLLALPQGYDTEIGQNGTGLSLRERRAVALARAMFGAPRLIVLDEPELGLDGGSVRALVKDLADIKRSGLGLVIATQDQRLLALADRTVLLKDGQVQAFGTAAEVSRRLDRGRPHVVASAP